MKSKYIIFAILIGCILGVPKSIDLIKADFPGLDFQNLYAYHHCDKVTEINSNPYVVTGIECNDIMKRSMMYPPTLYRLFAFTTFFSTYRYAYYFWIFLLTIFAGLILYFWSDRKSAYSYLLLIPLYFQFPYAFSVERGNNDMLIVLVWTLAFVFVRNSFWRIGGIFAGLSVCLKLYPIIALAPIVVVGLGWGQSQKDQFKQRHYEFALSALLSIVFIMLSDFSLWYEYIFHVLPFWIGQIGGRSSISHSLAIFFPPVVKLAFFVIYFMVMMFISTKERFSNPIVTFSTGLACCTYFSGVSYDYNLVTVYPFIIVIYDLIVNKPIVNKKTLLFLLSLFFLAMFVIAPVQIFLNTTFLNQIRVVLMISITLLIAILSFSPKCFHMLEKISRLRNRLLG